MNIPTLSLLVFIPTLAAALLAHPYFKGNSSAARFFSLGVTALVFILSIGLLLGFDSHGGMQYQEHHSWVPSLGTAYSLGVDGISIWFFLLTTFLMVVASSTLWSVTQKVRGFAAAILICETAMLGVLVSLDLLLFYLFWELMLIPIYFMIGVWGGKRRIYASVKYVVYAFFGSIFLLLSIFFMVWLHFAQSGEVTFLIAKLASETQIPLYYELLMFIGCVIAFGLKLPLFPFHTWIPDAQASGPTGASVILSCELGLFGFLRVAYPLFPRAAEQLSPYLAIMAVMGVVFGGLVAWKQVDMKRLLAYSTLSHIGFAALGLVSATLVGITGALFLVICHGITAAALFLLVGFLYSQRGSHNIDDYCGLAEKLPIFSTLFLIFTLSAVALPLTNGFIPEFMALLGGFERFPLLTVIALSGVVLGAIYMLALTKKILFGKYLVISHDGQPNAPIYDLTPRQTIVFVPLVLLVFIMGIFPNYFLNFMVPSIEQLRSHSSDRAKALRDQDPESNLRKPDFGSGSFAANTSSPDMLAVSYFRKDTAFLDGGEQAIGAD